MSAVFRFWLLGVSIAGFAALAADIPPQPALASREVPHPLYYWQNSPVGNTAQLLTLFCGSCLSSNGAQEDVPLVSILRDTLGDNTSENDRVSSVWLLTYSSPNIGRRMLSAVPFFFWRAGEGSSSVSSRDTKPLFDLTAPQHPVMSEISRDLIQWTLFDPMTTTVRATSRAYRSNALDYERLHLEEAVSYLREAPTSDDASGPTATQLNTVIARLELRKSLLGGLVSGSGAARFGEESGYEQERIRSRNWELLRQCAEKAGLFFEPINLAGTTGQYAVLWFPLNESFSPAGISLTPVWKLLNIHDPWTDARLKARKGTVYTRALDADGSLLPFGESGSRKVQMVPLGVYSLNYPKLPLLLIDFRDKLHVRWHEMTQRSINEITAGVIGISHFTNWYYYVAADLYDFVTSRHGGAMDQAARLDSYSQFRVNLALDRQIDPRLRQEIQQHVNSLEINPLEAAPGREMQAARQRYAQLQAQTEEGGALMVRLNKQRRAELASFGETPKNQVAHDLFHTATFGLYTHRVKPDPENLSALDRDRRLEYHLGFLNSLANAGTDPEVAYDSSRVRASVKALDDLTSSINSPGLRQQTEAVLQRITSLSRDQDLQSDCSVALASLRRSDPALRRAEISGVLTSPRSLAAVSGKLDVRK